MKTQKVEVGTLAPGNMFLFLGAIWTVDGRCDGHLGKDKHVIIHRPTIPRHNETTWTSIEGTAIVEVILNCPPESKWKGRVKSFCFKVITSPAIWGLAFGMVFKPSWKELGLVLFGMVVCGLFMLKEKK